MAKAEQEGISTGLLVSLRAWEVEVPPGVTPDEAWQVGDPVQPPATLRHQRPGWRLKSNLPREAALESHVDELLARVGGSGTKIPVQTGEVQLSVAAYCVAGRCPDLVLPPEQVQRLGQLNASVDVDVYCW